MPAVSDESVPLKRADLVSLETDGELLVHYPGLQDPLSLNVSAHAILDLCDGKHTVAQLSRELADECGYPIEVLTSDVKCTVAQFEKVGVISLLNNSP